MTTVREFNSKRELIDHLKEKVAIFKIDDFSGLEIKFYCYDDRIDWDCYIVHMEGYGVFGFTNAIPE